MRLVPRRVDQRDRPVPRPPADVVEQIGMLPELRLVPAPEFLPALRVVPEPFPQLGARREILEPQVERRRVGQSRSTRIRVPSDSDGAS